MSDSFYDVLASRYDVLQSDMDCPKWASYVKGLIGKAKFVSVNKNIASVSSKGKIIAKKKGNAVIKVIANGVTLKCKVTVK